MSGSKQQILVIHGGNAFDRYEDYIGHLKQKEVSLSDLHRVDWKRNLGSLLGQDYEVYLPEMPNKQNARYVEWGLWFSKLIGLFNDDVILIGHSLGGILLAKYLSENTSSVRIKATFLVAAPFNTPENHPLVDFTLLKPLSDFAKQASELILFHSKDDHIVPYDNVTSYKEALPQAKLVTFSDRGHFLQPDFPELVAEIKELSAQHRSGERAL